MDPHQIRPDFQHTAGMSQLAELIVIVRVVVVLFLGRCPRLVEDVPRDDPQAIRHSFLLWIDPDHVLGNHPFQARLGLLQRLSLGLQLR